MQTLFSNGVRLHISDSGPRDGRVIMFANSLGTDFRVWDPLIPHLPEGLRLVRFDKRGHGLSDCPAAPYDIETLVSDAATVVETLDLHDITFVGLSIGGLIGQGLAARMPERLQGLVLVDTAAKIGSPEMWNDRIAALREGGIEGLAEAILDRWFAPDFRNNPDVLTPWQHMLTRTPLEGYIGCCQAIAGADFTQSTADLTLPVLAMAGSEDGSTPPDLVRATAELCGGAFHVIADAGHLPNVEKPALTASLITQFMESLTK